MSYLYYLKTILSLGFVLGVLYAALRWGQWAQKKKYSSEMKIVDRLSLAPNIALLIVQIRDESYIAGLGGKDLKFLRKIK